MTVDEVIDHTWCESSSLGQLVARGVPPVLHRVVEHGE